jgi:ribonucleoside-diphosphate reductase alpha chain
MTPAEWKNRLQAAVEKDGRSMRDISLAAGLSHGYLHGVLKDGKEPTLERFVKICRVLDLSVSEALLGVHISPTVEALLKAVQDNPEKAEALARLLDLQD